MPKANIPDGQAQKIARARAKVVAHRADQAGSLRLIFQNLGILVKLLADTRDEVDESLQNELKILFHVIQRFSKHVRTLSTKKAGALKQSLTDITLIERQLKAATSSSYGVKRLIAEGERDLAHVQKLRQNLQLRYREAAFVLAELEQAVDPVSDLKLASAAQRKRNDKARRPGAPVMKAAKTAAKKAKPPVAPKPDPSTS